MQNYKPVNAWLKINLGNLLEYQAFGDFNDLALSCHEN